MGGGRPKLKPGEHGNISASKQRNGRWRARVRYCNLLGEEGTTSGVGPTKTSFQNDRPGSLRQQMMAQARCMSPRWRSARTS